MVTALFCALKLANALYFISSGVSCLKETIIGDSFVTSMEFLTWAVKIGAAVSGFGYSKRESITWFTDPITSLGLPVEFETNVTFKVVFEGLMPNL